MWQYVYLSHNLSFEFDGLIYLLYSAVDLRRHIACEVCDPSVSGGYDPLLNQVAVF
jgi:inner membrane protease ATP23